MADITITEGDTLEVDYSLENTGDGTGTFDPRLLVQGVQEDQDTGITLDPAQTATGTLAWPTEDGDAVTDALAEAVTDDTSDSITVTVEYAIPQEDDLYARYDFSQEDGALPITDQTGNGRALSNGQYSGVSANINGVQAGLFDGVDDSVWTSFTTQNQPNHIFIIAEYVSLDTGGNNAIFDANTANDNLVFADYGGQSGEYNLYAGSRLGGTTVADAGDIVVIGGLFDGAGSVLRLNGAQDDTGDVGAGGLDGVTLGSTGTQDNYANVKIGEVLVYPQDKSPTVADIEQYLIDKWGPVGFV